MLVHFQAGKWASLFEDLRQEAQESFSYFEVLQLLFLLQHFLHVADQMHLACLDALPFCELTDDD